MDIRIRGRAKRFEDVPSGTFFCALRDERIFGICVSEGTRAGALIFTPKSGQRGVPWLVGGGLPHDDLVTFPGAALRADTLSAVAFEGQIAVGAVINFDEHFFINASNGMGSNVTCNLRTGALELLPQQATVFNIYTSWQIGYFEGEDFEPIFSFPSSP